MLIRVFDLLSKSFWLFYNNKNSTVLLLFMKAGWPATERRRERRCVWERETRRVARRERDVPRDARETRERPLTRETADRWRERTARERERTRVRRARASPNIRDTHERASESRRLNKASGEGDRESWWVISGHPLRGARGERSDTVSDHSARDRQVSVWSQTLRKQRRMSGHRHTEDHRLQMC